MSAPVHNVTSVPRPRSIWLGRATTIVACLSVLTFVVWDTVDRLGPANTHKCLATGCVVATHIAVVVSGLSRIMLILGVALLIGRPAIIKLWYVPEAHKAAVRQKLWRALVPCFWAWIGLGVAAQLLERVA